VKLSTYKTVPHNGLVLFCGFIGEEGKQKKIMYTFEPLKPLMSGLYRCDSKFHLDSLYEQLEEKHTYGFIIVDGNGVSFHTLNGNAKRNLCKLEVSLPKKHGRGGQSKNRFARIREEKRGWYTSKVAEMAIAQFIDPVSSLPNVHGIVLAGSAQLKEEVQSKLDPRLTPIVVAVVDIQYGGESGFCQAVRLTKDSLGNLKYTHEQKVVSRLFEEINLDGSYAIGIDDTMYSLTNGLLDTLIIWNDLKHIRWELIKSSTNETKIVYLNEDKTLEETNDWSVKTKIPLLDWVLDHYAEFGAQIELVSDQTDVGAQFVKGFGGLGGLTRYQTELPSNNDQLLENTEDEDEDEYEYVW
jgi:peptide chain release factor subunit 1